MKVLFIGNSHTYFNDMPYIFKQICQENSIDVEVTMLARGYKGLDYHCKEPQTRFNILYGNYDYIVLQHLQSGFSKEVLYNSTKMLKEWINISGATPILYMTWSMKAEREKQKELSEGYKEVGEKLGITVAPVGEVWWRYFDSYPEDILYFKDDKHASKLGSTLAAYTIFSTIFCEKAKTRDEICNRINGMIK